MIIFNWCIYLQHFAFCRPCHRCLLNMGSIFIFSSPFILSLSVPQPSLTSAFHSTEALFSIYLEPSFELVDVILYIYSFPFYLLSPHTIPSISFLMIPFFILHIPVCPFLYIYILEEPIHAEFIFPYSFERYLNSSFTQICVPRCGRDSIFVVSLAAKIL